MDNCILFIYEHVTYTLDAFGFYQEAIFEVSLLGFILYFNFRGNIWLNLFTYFGFQGDIMSFTV